MAFSRSRNGQSVVEVLIAVALLALMTTASFVLLATSFSESLISQEDATAQNLLIEGVEAVRQIRDRDFTLLTAGSHGLVKGGTDWIFSGTQDITQSTYTRTVAITETDDDTRDVTVRVQWTPRPDRPLDLQIATRFTDWQTPPAPPSSNCSASGVSGNWAAPIVLGTADIGSGNQGTDVVVDLPYVYMSGVAASSSKPDFFVFDATNPASPQLIRSVDIGADGINSLFYKDDHVYAASGNDTKEFMIFDVSTPSTAFLAGSTNLPGSADAITVTVKDTLAAVGRSSSSDNELFFYDITNPAIPSLLLGVDVAGHVNDFASSNDYLFAVTSAATGDLMIYDITNLLSPTLAISYNIADDAEDISVAFQDPDTLFIGNKSNKLIVLDVENFAEISEITSINTNGEVRDVVCVVGDLAFLGTTNSNKEFIVYDISNPESVTEYSSLNFPQVTGGVDFADNKVFTAVRSNDALRIITSSP